MKDEEKSTSNAVPRFGSFRPKPSSKSTPGQDSASSRRDGHRRKSVDPDRSNSARPRQSVASHTNPERQSRGWCGLDQSSQNHSPQKDTAQSVFVFDRNGDEDNVRFGSLHRGSVPSFHRSGSGGILGLHASRRLDKQKATDRELILKDEGYPRRRNKDKIISYEQPNDREDFVLHLQTNEPAFSSQADYLPLQTSKDRRMTPYSSQSLDANASSSESEDVGASSSNALEGPSINTGATNEGSHSSKARLDVQGSSADLKLAAELAKGIEENPQDGALWLKLIRSQEARAVDWASKLATYDIKLDMYEKALGRVTNPTYREPLLTAMMRDLSKIWDANAVKKKWDSILRENNRLPRLWIAYLDFMQTSFSIFRFDDLRQTFVQCLEALRFLSSMHDNLSIHELRLYVLLRATIAMKQSGFTELALAVWQANLEYNVCKVSSPDYKDTSSSRESFEGFWDSEVPRIGEDGARGWSSQASIPEDPPSLRQDNALTDAEGLELLKSWSMFENKRTVQGRMPARTGDDSYEDDPFRVVLYSDIEPFLIEVPDQHSLLAVHGFLAFNGLPPLLSASSGVRGWWRDQLIRQDEMCSTKSDSNPAMGNPPADQSLGTLPGLAFPMNNYVTTLDTLFPRPRGWYDCFSSFQKIEANQSYPDLSYVSASLKLILDNILKADDELAEYFLALELRRSPDTVKKTARSLLKKNPSSVRLYNAYALIEFRLGNHDAGQSVLHTTANTMPAGYDLILLRRTETWELLESGNSDLALARLVSPDTKQSSPSGEEARASTVILRAQNHFLKSRDELLSLADYHRAAGFVECLILLSYLNTDASLESTASVLSSNASLFPESNALSRASFEILHQSLARIIIFHMNHQRPFKPVVVRDILSASASRFPNNTMILTLYAWNESRFRTDDRVRSKVREILSKIPDANTVTSEELTENYITLLFAIQSEFNRSFSLGSNVHSIRSAFEKAVESDYALHSTSLWKWYFDFELRRGFIEKAKMVFYRAIRACPWSKDLYVLPFTHLISQSGLEEARGWYEMIVEKELRIHVSLTETFENLGV